MSERKIASARSLKVHSADGNAADEEKEKEKAEAAAEAEAEVKAKEATEAAAEKMVKDAAKAAKKAKQKWFKGMETKRDAAMDQLIAEWNEAGKQRQAFLAVEVAKKKAICEKLREIKRRKYQYSAKNYVELEASEYTLKRKKISKKKDKPANAVDPKEVAAE